MKFLWAVIGVTACTAVAPEQPAPAAAAESPLPREVRPAPVERAPGAIRLRFAWPQEGTVKVKETVRRKGHTAEFVYQLAWAPDAEGGFVIEPRDHRCTAMDGSAISEETAAALSAASGINDSFRTRMRIGADGELLEVLDMAAVAADLVKLTRLNTAISEEERQEIASTLQSPAALEMLGAASRQKWHAWVGAWLEGEVVPGGSVTHTEEVPTLQGGTARAQVTLSALEPETVDGKVRIRLALDTVFDPDSLAAAAQALPEQALTARAQALQQEAMDQVGRIERQDHLEVLTDPATLMPRKVLRRTATTLFDKAGASLGTRKEQFLYEFEWPN